MVLVSFLVALVVAAIMTAIFAWVFRSRKSWTGRLSFYLLVLVAAWAGGIWVSPPYAGRASGAPWVSEFIVGFVASLLMSSSMPAWGRQLQSPGAVQTERRSPPVSLLTPAYWVALFVLLVAIIVH